MSCRRIHAGRQRKCLSGCTADPVRQRAWRQCRFLVQQRHATSAQLVLGWDRRRHVVHAWSMRQAMLCHTSARLDRAECRAAQSPWCRYIGLSHCLGYSSAWGCRSTPMVKSQPLLQLCCHCALHARTCSHKIPGARAELAPELRVAQIWPNDSPGAGWLNKRWLPVLQWECNLREQWRVPGRCFGHGARGACEPGMQGLGQPCQLSQQRPRQRRGRVQTLNRSCCGPAHAFMRTASQLSTACVDRVHGRLLGSHVLWCVPNRASAMRQAMQPTARMHSYNT